MFPSISKDDSAEQKTVVGHNTAGMHASKRCDGSSVSSGIRGFASHLEHF